MVRQSTKGRDQRLLSKSEQALVRLVRNKRVAPAESRSLSHKAYAALRQAIQEGVLEASTHLTEVDVAQWLGMSRTPVREAMRRLESEGLLQNEPFRGAVIVTLGEADIKELYAVRELLEVEAAGACAERAQPTQIAAMRALVEDEANRLDDPRALIDINRRFHQAICDGAHNRFLQKALATIQSSFALLGKSNLLSPERARASHRQHVALLNAIAARDRKAAEEAARTHVRNSRDYRVREARARKTPEGAGAA
ncbi:MAG: GntR family transcriptional regulator [Rhodospirillaceae bacterium]